MLARGLPQLPTAVGVDDFVPLARWVSNDWAAILHVSYCGPEPDIEMQKPYLDTETVGYHRVGGVWVAASASGGTTWSDSLELVRPPDVGRRDAICIHAGSYSEGELWTCGVADGVAGMDATVIEVEQFGRVVQNRIDSPVGAWVAAFDGNEDVIVRVRADDALLMEEAIAPSAVP